jgi:hypothetical protein
MRNLLLLVLSTLVMTHAFGDTMTGENQSNAKPAKVTLSPALPKGTPVFNASPSFGYSYYNPYVRPGYYYYPATVTVPKSTRVVETKVRVPAKVIPAKTIQVPSQVTIPASTIPAHTVEVPAEVMVPAHEVTPLPVVLPSPVVIHETANANNIVSLSPGQMAPAEPVNTAPHPAPVIYGTPQASPAPQEQPVMITPIEPNTAETLSQPAPAPKPGTMPEPATHAARASTTSTTTTQTTTTVSSPDADLPLPKSTTDLPAPAPTDETLP